MTLRLSHRISLPLLVLLSSTPSTVLAAQAAPIDGFRSAQFGMDQARVEAAIAKDFHPDPAAISAIDNPAEQTRVIVVHLPALEPGPGPATVSYIMGTKTHKLIHINVTWSAAPGAPKGEQLKITAAGVQLANYLREQYAKPGVPTTGLPDAKGVVLFATTDARNAAIQLRLSGVEVAGAALPAGRAQLVLSYFADVRHPDVGGARKAGQ
jgi:hypothetical protein